MASYNDYIENQDNDDNNYPEDLFNDEDNYPENSSNEGEDYKTQEVRQYEPEFDKQFIPGNSIVKRYNQEFYNILKQIPEIKRSIRNINEYIQQHIIPPQYVNVRIAVFYSKVMMQLNM